MADNQYDVSERMKKLFEEKQKQRLAAKNYYRNFLYNPYRPPNDGPPFDPAILRYGAMSTYHYETYRPRFKQFAAWFLFLSPIGLFSWYLHSIKEKQEKLLRSGAVAYSDRQFKLIQ